MRKRWAILRWACTAGAALFALLLALSLQPKLALTHGAYHVRLSKGWMEFICDKPTHEWLEAEYRARLAASERSIAAARRRNDVDWSEANINRLALVEQQHKELLRRAETHLYSGALVDKPARIMWIHWGPGVWLAGLPIAIPLISLAAIAVALWHPYFRRLKPFTCPKCNYSLTGLPAGAACPECGKASGATA